MLGDWKMKTRSPGNNLSVTVSVKHPVLGNYFTAFLTAKRVLSTSKVNYALFFWLMPQKAAIYTYWQVSNFHIYGTCLTLVAFIYGNVNINLPILT